MRLRGVGLVAALDGHDLVVEHDGEDADLVAHGSLDVHPDHADGGVAHDVDAQLVRLGELRAHDRAQPETKLGGLAPSDVGPGRRALPHRRQLVAGTARVVRDDGVRHVDVVVQVVDDAVLVDRNLVGRELRHPVVEPFLPNLRHFGRDVAGVPVACAVRPPLDVVDQPSKRELRVSQKRVVGLVVLVDVAGVRRRVDERLAGRNRLAVRRPRETRADGEYQIGLLQEVPRALRVRHRGRAQRERVVFGEGALARHRGGHRRLEKLGYLLQLVPSLRVEAALPCVYHRTLGLQQRLCNLSNSPRRRHGLVPKDRRVVQLARKLLRPDVARGLKEHGAALARPKLVEGAAHEFGDALDHVDLCAPLGDVRVVVVGAEVRLDECLGLELASGKQQDGRVVRKGLGRSRKGVLAPGALLHGEHPQPLAVGDAAEPVGDCHADALLAAYDRADARLRRRVNHRLGRIDRQEFRPLAPEDLRDCVCSLHVRSHSYRLLSARCGDFTLTLALSLQGRGDKY